MIFYLEKRENFLTNIFCHFTENYLKMIDMKLLFYIKPFDK